ncbi:transposase [Streptomyces sp. NPDC048442]|uniref:transposase n=1 Tax=Streptomyces sp. NPDC048442 TaxID=3154823 RepID=UPI00342801F1
MRPGKYPDELRERAVREVLSSGPPVSPVARHHRSQATLNAVRQSTSGTREPRACSAFLPVRPVGSYGAQVQRGATRTTGSTLARGSGLPTEGESEPPPHGTGPVRRVRTAHWARAV